MENPIKHFYSISTLLLGHVTDHQFNFYAGDYLKKDTSSFDLIAPVAKKEILTTLDHFIERLPSEGINLMVNRGADTNFLGFNLDLEESDCYKFAFLFFTNRTEIVELREENRYDNYISITSHIHSEYLEKLRRKAVFVNHTQNILAFYSHE